MRTALDPNQNAGLLGKCPAGYEIAEYNVDPEGLAYSPVTVGAEANALLLVERAIEPLVWYDPLGGNGKERLHRRFAAISAKNPAAQHDAIVSFASRFGLLDRNVRIIDLDPHQPTSRWPALHQSRRADIVDHWLRFADEIAALLALWELCIERKVMDLSALARWHVPTGDWLTAFGWDGKRLAPPDEDLPRQRLLFISSSGWINPRQIDQFSQASPWWGADRLRLSTQSSSTTNEIINAVRRAVSQQINAGLSGTVEPHLDLLLDSEDALTFRPKTLRGAIWLHFALEAAEEAPKLVRCANPRCSRMFRPRRGKLACSDVCRVELWRAQKRQKSSR